MVSNGRAMTEIEQAYQTLGLARGASSAAVKQAYRDLVKVWHPDRFPQDHRLHDKVQEQLKGINLAYATVLEDLARPRAARSHPHSDNSNGPTQRAAHVYQTQSRASYEFQTERPPRQPPAQAPRSPATAPSPANPAIYEWFFRVAKFVAVLLSLNLIRLILVHCGAE